MKKISLELILLCISLLTQEYLARKVCEEMLKKFQDGGAKKFSEWLQDIENTDITCTDKNSNNVCVCCGDWFPNSAFHPSEKTKEYECVFIRNGVHCSLKLGNGTCNGFDSCGFSPSMQCKLQEGSKCFIKIDGAATRKNPERHQQYTTPSRSMTTTTCDAPPAESTETCTGFMSAMIVSLIGNVICIFWAVCWKQRSVSTGENETGGCARGNKMNAKKSTEDIPLREKTGAEGQVSKTDN